jgi:FtsP/CotA-like multicopper oxidase with cupredoxin domain
MKRLIRFERVLLAACVAAVAGWPLAQLATAGPTEPAVPTAIQVPDGNKVFLVGHAVGGQIYSCDVTSSGYGWAFVAPRANLYDNNGKLVATHFAGPTWQAKDGSHVIGRVEDRVTVDPTAIPWLRLAATSTAAGTEGDRLVATTYIQRISTTGGLAPASADCNADASGTTDEVPYTADYYFWKAVGG